MKKEYVRWKAIYGTAGRGKGNKCIVMEVIKEEDEEEKGRQEEERKMKGKQERGKGRE